MMSPSEDHLLPSVVEASQKSFQEQTNGKMVAIQLMHREDPLVMIRSFGELAEPIAAGLLQVQTFR